MSQQPLATNTQSRYEPENKQRFPIPCECGETCEQRIRKNCNRHGSAAAKPIANPPEGGTTQGPSNEEGGLDKGGVVADGLFIFCVKQLCHKRGGNQHIQIAIQTIK
jgi:hypothetical protein